MPEVIVADRCPLISCARAKKLQILQEICKSIIIPPAVFEEIVIKVKGKPVSEEIREATWINVQIPRNRPCPDESGHHEGRK